MSSASGVSVSSPRDPHEPDRVVHRTSGFNWAGFVGGAPMFALGIVGFARNPGVHDRTVFIGGTIAVFLLLVLYAFAASPRLKRETLTVDGSRLIYRGAWRTHVSDVRGGRAVDLQYKMMGGTTYRRWLFLDEQGVVNLRLKIGPWRRKELHELASSLGLPVETVDEPVKPRTARHTYPGSWSWWGAHPASSFLMVACGIVVIVTIIDAILAGPSS